jgi:large subunit ribosomal protein L9
MELILKNDVEHLGFKDDVVTVKPGYGRNYLIPQGLAVMATPSAKKQLEETLRQRQHKEQKHIKEAEMQAEKLKELDLKIPAKSGEGNKLFGSITAADLSLELKKHGIDIDKKFISIAGGNIKRLGLYHADIRFHREVNSTFEFEVVEDKSN